jgi:hypothetical protein
LTSACLLVNIALWATRRQNMITNWQMEPTEIKPSQHFYFYFYFYFVRQLKLLFFISYITSFMKQIILSSSKFHSRSQDCLRSFPAERSSFKYIYIYIYKNTWKCWINRLDLNERATFLKKQREWKELKVNGTRHNRHRKRHNVSYFHKYFKGLHSVIQLL